VAAGTFLARVLWLQGFPDQAMRTAEGNVEDAHAANHVMTLCSTLSQAPCHIALLVGDLAAAEHYVRMLLDHSTRHALALWRNSVKALAGHMRVSSRPLPGVVSGILQST